MPRTVPRKEAHVWILGLALAIAGCGFAAGAAGEEYIETVNDLSGLLTAPVNEDSTVEAAREIYQSADEEGVETAPVKRQLESLEEELVSLNRDLLILEEDLLYPASSRVSVFLSMDLGKLFSLDSVTLKLNGRKVTHFLYTAKQVDALYRGGVQRLFVGNARQGDNEITAFFVGRGKKGREFKRAATINFEKTFEPVFVELTITDSTAKQQPEFIAEVH